MTRSASLSRILGPLAALIVGATLSACGPAGTSAGGTGGAAVGGASTSGGAPGNSGGAPGTGGASTSGGAPGNSGGASGTGGAGTSGGASGTGGNAAAGGRSGPNGGSTGTGGAGQAGGSATGGRPGGSGGQGGGTTGAGGTLASNCQPMLNWMTADPSTKGPFEIVAEKGVGPMAGALPDPVYGNVQQRFNIYRPKDLTQGYCHPILVWANGHTDNPEPKPPECISSNYCGSYLAMLQHMASHGFVIIASLSTITSQGNPLPTIIGLDWLIQQANDPASPYYKRLDTAHIGAFGHSEGGASTCIAASDPRITAISTVSGTRANPNFHQPVLFFCGEKDTVVKCAGVTDTYKTITTQPAMLINNLAADHGGWLYQNGAKGPDIFGLTAWFRVHLMGDTANRKYFYGANCTFCTDTRVTVMRNNLLTQ